MQNNKTATTTTSTTARTKQNNHKHLATPRIVFNKLYLLDFNCRHLFYLLDNERETVDKLILMKCY